MDGFNMLRDFNRMAREFSNFIENDLPSYIQTEGENHFKESFENEGFTDSTLEKWKERKTTDSRGRDLTRKRDGSISKYGESIQGRNLLEKKGLLSKIRSRHSGQNIIFYTHANSEDGVNYDKFHNEGTDKLPKRQFMGESKKLTDTIKDKIKQRLDTLFS